jgi:hypothetical protein
MTVYVDPLASWGWRLRGRVVQSCHMFTDDMDLVELHRLASMIGMRREWFQDSRSAPHYDLTPRRRAEAIRMGAVEVDRATAAGIWRRRREATSKLNLPVQ